MFNQISCPPWEYRHHPACQSLLPGRVEKEFRAIETNPHSASFHLCTSTVGLHQRLFNGLCPTGQSYLAGNYRGTDFPCLVGCMAVIDGDHGFPPGLVQPMMSRCAKEMRDALTYLDELHRAPDPAEPLKRLYTAEIAAYILGGFCRVHPYANGNGHSSRMLVFSVLGRYGYWPHAWSLTPRGEPERYDQLFRDFRQNNVEPMIEYILEKIAAPVADETV